MMTQSHAGELFQSGKLAEAITAAREHVKQHPAELNGRAFLAQLLCFCGEWERAEQHLQTVVQQHPKAAIGANLVRLLIRAEVARQQFFTEGRLPEFPDKPGAVAELHLRASIACREGAWEEAVGLLADAESQRVHPNGKCNDAPMDDFRDLDDLTACVLEVFALGGKYFWFPIDQIRCVELQPPRIPQDLLWKSGRITLHSGWEGDVFLPVLYPLTYAQEDDTLRLGRATTWLEEPNRPVRGLGHKMFLVGDDTRVVQEISRIELEAGSAASATGE